MNEKERRAARKGLVIYFAVLIVASAFFEWKILQTGESIDQVPPLVVALMFTPAVASVIARVSLHEGFADVSFRLGGPEGKRAMGLAWLYPIVVGLFAYTIAWTTGLAGFRPPLSACSHLYVDAAAPNLIASLLVSTTLGTAFNCLSAFGEEAGWRGYMLTRLVIAGVPKPVFASGLVWALWHVPLILSGQHAAGARRELSATLFVIGVIAEAYLVAYLRLRSGSVWPAVIMHGAWNAVIQGTFDRATVGTPAAVGESGWLTVIFSVAFMLAVTRGVWTLQRQPGEMLVLPSARPASAVTF
jgi:membrane protease YdiL (CAAX protease family)